MKFIRFTVLVVCVVVGVGILRSVYTLSQKRGILGERQRVLSELTAKNRQLHEDLRIATNPAFIEQAARDKLGLVREGEIVVIMDKTSVANSDSQNNPQELPSWKQWWSLFF
jgi:cell division protein FtsB